MIPHDDRSRPAGLRRTLPITLTILGLVTLAGCDDNGATPAAGPATPAGTATTAPATPPAGVPDAATVGAPTSQPEATVLSEDVDLWEDDGDGDFPDEWYFKLRGSEIEALEGKAAPPVKVAFWINDTTAIAAEDMKGRVTVLTFWTTNGPGCIHAIPQNLSLVERYGDRGMTFVAIHDSRGGIDLLSDCVKSNDVTYPVAVDDNNQTVEAWGNVPIWPMYMIVDADGIVRAAGVRTSYVHRVVEALLIELDAKKAAASG